VAREKDQVGRQKMTAALNVGATLLGALMGRRIASVGNVGRASTAMKSAGRIGKESADVERAAESAGVLRERLASLEQQFEQETEQLRGRFDLSSLPIDKTQLRPRKSDILVGQVGLCWTP
jgi:hypothetical protein